MSSISSLCSLSRKLAPPTANWQVQTAICAKMWYRMKPAQFLKVLKSTLFLNQLMFSGNQRRPRLWQATRVKAVSGMDFASLEGKIKLFCFNSAVLFVWMKGRTQSNYAIIGSFTVSQTWWPRKWLNHTKVQICKEESTQPWAHQRIS